MDNIISSVLSTQNLGVLATMGKEYPYTSLVGFVPNEDNKNIIFATMKATKKYNNIKKNPRVSILVNNSINSEDDFKDAVALTIMGEGSTVDSAEKEQYEKLYLKRFPFLDDFIKNPLCELIKVRVTKYITVTNFQDVKEFKI